ncbi:MAG: Dabb family protein, partial [Clostridia bacterium]
MVRHIVCFKLKDNSDGAKKAAEEVLNSMRGVVHTIRGFEVGTDYLGSERSYDVVLITTFDEKVDLESYQVDPYHVDVVKKYMHSVVETSVSVDYE